MKDLSQEDLNILDELRIKRLVQETKIKTLKTCAFLVFEGMEESDWELNKDNARVFRVLQILTPEWFIACYLRFAPWAKRKLIQEVREYCACDFVSIQLSHAFVVKTKNIEQVKNK